MIDDNNPTEVSRQAHLKSDVDSSARAQHHTLGKGPQQASRGDHNHDSQYRPITYDPFTTGDTKLSYAPADNVTWFEAGSSLLRTGPAAALFALFGTTYGAVDGTHFNLPDSRGEYLRVATAAKAPGTEDGSNTATLVAANLPPHTHTTPNHNHPIDNCNTPGTNNNTVVRGNGVIVGTTVVPYNPNTAGGSNTGDGNFANTPVTIEPRAHYLRLLIHA